MCGICGIVKNSPEALGHVIRRMNDAQKHRGPDGEGYYIAGRNSLAQFEYDGRLEAATSCALGHRRLAVIDPEGGAQPMMSEDSQIAVLLNGEIYNFQEIRDRLKRDGCHFKTDSDTEVLVHLYRENPDDPARWLSQLNGIFALAIWDNRQERLLISRDHYGVKPLHYFCENGTFLFASEIKSILAAGIKPCLNRAALHVFLNVRYVPGRETLFRGVYRLPAAHYAWVKQGCVERVERYYSLPEINDEGLADTHEIETDVRTTFEKAVERQLVSDVPVGMALSGGLDSSMIVAAASSAYQNAAGLRTADTTLRTFTLGFNEPTDENEDAQIIANHFGTEHHETMLPANPLESAKAVIRAVEEPKINMLQGYMLAGFVRSKVKVVFGGLGGDELFAGYDIHRYCNTLGRLNPWIGSGIQRLLFRPLSSAIWNLQSRSGMLKTEHYRIGAQIALASGDPSQFYCRLRNAWDYDAPMYSRIYASPDEFRAYPSTDSYFSEHFDQRGSVLDKVLRVEFGTKMVDDFLLNEDRVTSAHGVEGRVPFLDRDLVELAFRIPSQCKMRGRETKTLWKESSGDALPEAIRRKKKHGFTFSSYHQWEKDLKHTIEKELSEGWLREAGIINPDFIRGLLEYPAHPNMRWHYFVAWMMLGLKQWGEVFDVEF